MFNTVLNTYLEQLWSFELLLEWQLLSQKEGTFMWFSVNNAMLTSENIPTTLHFHKQYKNMIISQLPCQHWVCSFSIILLISQL